MSLSQSVCLRQISLCSPGCPQTQNVGHWGFQGDPPASVPRLLHSGVTAVCWPNLAKIGSKKHIVCVFICRGCTYVPWCMEVRGQSLMLVLWCLLSFWDRVSLACTFTVEVTTWPCSSRDVPCLCFPFHHCWNYNYNSRTKFRSPHLPGKLPTELSPQLLKETLIDRKKKKRNKERKILLRPFSNNSGGSHTM